MSYRNVVGILILQMCLSARACECASMYMCSLRQNWNYFTTPPFLFDSDSAATAVAAVAAWALYEKT